MGLSSLSEAKSAYTLSPRLQQVRTSQKIPGEHFFKRIKLIHYLMHLNKEETWKNVEVFGFELLMSMSTENKENTHTHPK